MKEEFERNLDRVQVASDELSDEEIMRDADLARHAFHQVGAYDGPTIVLDTEHATGIRHRGQLARVLEESEGWLWLGNRPGSPGQLVNDDHRPLRSHAVRQGKVAPPVFTVPRKKQIRDTIYR